MSAKNSTSRAKKPIDKKWLTVDWGLSPSEIAEQLNVSKGTVFKYKKILGIKPSKPGFKSKIDWDSVDWSKSIAQVAAELDVPRSTVETARKRIGIITQYVNWDLVDWSKDDGVIALEVNRVEGRVRTKRNEAEARNFALSERGTKDLAKLLAKKAIINMMKTELDELLISLSDVDRDAIKAEFHIIANSVSTDDIESADNWLK